MTPQIASMLVLFLAVVGAGTAIAVVMVFKAMQEEIRRQHRDD